MPSNETLADNIVDSIREGGLPNKRLVEIICNNVPYEILLPLEADVASAVDQLDAAIDAFVQARDAARPSLHGYEFGRAS